MKFLVAPALLATAAQATRLYFTSGTETGANYKIGTDFALEWTTSDPKSTDTFNLTMSAWNKTQIGTETYGWATIPIFDTIDVVLDDAVRFSDEVYHWTVEALDAKGVWKGDQFNYGFTASWSNSDIGEELDAAFHIVD